MELNSCLYECDVMHHRLRPKQHRFNYRIFMFALDLDEIDDVARRVRGFSRNRWNFYSFWDVDHLEPKPGAMKEKAAAYLRAHGRALPPGGRIVLITFPRVFGYVFNPVSFYFFFDGEGDAFAALAEVGNTFREMKLYFIPDQESPGRFRLRVPKHFYVSPFSDLDLVFDFKLRVPSEILEIHVNDFDGAGPILLSTLSGRRAPLTSRRLAAFTWRYPLITLRVIWLIHWHALLLFLKRVPFAAKTARREDQRDVLRPHATLNRKTS